MFEAASTLLDYPDDKDAPKTIKAVNEGTLDPANLFTGQLEAQNANPADLMQSDIMLLEHL